MTRSMELEIGFSLGSNLGDRLQNLVAAKEALLSFPDARQIAQSTVFETEPVGVQPEHAHLLFLNAVLILSSSLPVEGWLTRLGDIENTLSRERSEDRYAPRTIDIDILYAGESCIDSGGLVVPHPRWMERRFVVAPLAELRPDRILPGAGKSVRQILDHLPPGEACHPLPDSW